MRNLNEEMDRTILYQGPPTYNISTDELVKLLVVILDQRDTEIKELLNRLDRLTAIIELSQKISVLGFIDET